MKHLKKIELIIENTSKMTAYNVFVSFREGDTDVNEIFLNKVDAQKSADESNIQLDTYYNSNDKYHKYKAITLDDAIYAIRREIESQELL
jgi:isocitrate dehydrogenase